VVIPRCEAGIGMNYERCLEEICKYAFVYFEYCFSYCLNFPRLFMKRSEAG
jgi:hypothetical protein